MPRSNCVRRRSPAPEHRRVLHRLPRDGSAAGRTRARDRRAPARSGAARHLHQARLATRAGDRGDQRRGRRGRSTARALTEARIALGCVAPTIVRAPEAEAALTGSTLERADRLRAAELAARRDRADRRRPRPRPAIAARRSPRSSNARSNASPTAPKRAVSPVSPVLLETPRTRPRRRPFAGTVATTINGRPPRARRRRAPLAARRAARRGRL